MATKKKPTSKMSAADRKSYAYANSQQKYEENLALTRTAQDKVRKAKELNSKARSLAIMAGNSGMRSKADQREERLRTMDDKNAATLKQAVRNVSVGDAARARVASKKKK